MGNHALFTHKASNKSERAQNYFRFMVKKPVPLLGLKQLGYSRQVATG